MAGSKPRYQGRHTALRFDPPPTTNQPHTQVLARLDLPDDAFQPFQPNDQAKARVLLESAFCASHPRWREEVAAMVGFREICRGGVF